MNVTSTTQTQYTTTSNTANNTKIKEGDIDPNKGQNYTLKTLDKEGNELLNQALEGKTDEEKWKIKLVIDLNLSMEIKNGELTHITNIDNSKSNAISRLEAYVTMQRKLDNPDMMGVIAASEKFLEAYKNSDSTKDVKNQENSVVDKFLEDLYSKESITFQSNDTKEQLTTQQELEIKQQVAQTMSETEESPLATAIQESSQTQSVEETKATGKLAEMQEKYKDVYSPISETYSVKDEELQIRKVHEAYPNYISGPDFLQIVSSFLEGTRIELGQKLTPAQEEAQKLDYAQAFQKAYDIFGGEEEFIAMQKGVQAIKYQYPINEWAKQGYADNSKELARFTNAAIYEGLERGLSLEDATKEARTVESMFMDVSYGSKMLDDMLIKAGLMSPAPEGGRKTVQTEVNFDHPGNGTMDLRAYGIDGAWDSYEVIENQKGMLQEIEKKISQFNFMLNNKELIKEAIMKLPADARGVVNNEGYESWINEELMPRMQLGYEVFSKYQIYDN
jgi:hypothetical protein